MSWLNKVRLNVLRKMPSTQTSRLPRFTEPRRKGEQEWRNIKEEDLVKRWRIIRGDTVMINSGKDRGKTGVIQEVVRKKNAVVVKGLKLKKRKIAPVDGEKGSIQSIEGLIHVSNVSLVDPSSKKPTRVRFGFLENGEKARISVKSGLVIPKPSATYERTKPRRTEEGWKDTSVAEASRKTYIG
eukprot:comp9253_c0_seq1/m.10609 comp9253_c0_seq1/g.10609  ORF comp9253_c0_seq1/g.10609 comp9253_c0_seq1/m.10609 type:complete len:184 (+) comp9253_c0_seq1:39-590(+)